MVTSTTSIDFDAQLQQQPLSMTTYASLQRHIAMNTSNDQTSITTSSNYLLTTLLLLKLVVGDDRHQLSQSYTQKKKKKTL